MIENKSDNAFRMLAICLILAYLLPYHMHPFMAFFNDWLALFGVALVIVFWDTNESTKLRFPWVAYIPLGLIGLIIIQIAIGKLTVKWDAILPIAYLIGAVFALMIGATFGSESDGAKRICSTLAWAHLIAGLISGVITTIQITGIEEMFHPFVMAMPQKGVIRPSANLGQPNQLALLFCLGIASSWFLYQTGKLWINGAVASILIMLWGLTLTQSRVGWLIIPVLFLFTGMWRNYATLKSVSIRFSVALTIGYVIFILILPEIDFGAGLERRAGSPEERLGSISLRLELLQQAWHMSLTYPWLGAGWNEFGPQQLYNGADLSPAIYSRHAHNIVFNFAAEMGWLATILIFTALAYWFYQSCLVSMLKRTLSPEVGFAILFLSAVFVHSLLEFPLWYAYVLIPTALLMGVVQHAQMNSSVMLLPRSTLLIVSLIAGAGLLMVARDYHRLVHGFLAHGWENFGLKADEGSTEMPDWTVFPHFYDYFKFTKTDAKENMSPDDIAFMEHTAKRFGYPSVMMRMSLIYALNGRSKDALRMIKTLKNLHSPVRYREAYGAWKAMAEFDPIKYSEVFNQLPLPIDQLITRASCKIIGR